MGLLGGKKKKSKSPAPQQKREQTPPKKSKKPETPKKGKSAPAAAPAAARQEEEQFVGAIPEGSPLSKAEIANRIVCSREPQSLFELGITPNGVGITLRYAYVSQRGYYPDDLYKANQDAFKISTKFNQSDKPQMLLGVFDGHGGEGDRCSYFVRDKIEVELADQMKKQPKDFGKAYSAAFTSLGRKIHEQEEFDDSMSGTTAIAAFFHGTHVTIANIGDSRAMVGKKKGKVVAHSLSVDQTPYRKDERDRVKACGARIMTMGMAHGEVKYYDGWEEKITEMDENAEPPRLFHGTSLQPGNAFTRSLGDSGSIKIGVVAEAEYVAAARGYASLPSADARVARLRREDPSPLASLPPLLSSMRGACPTRIILGWVSAMSLTLPPPPPLVPRFPLRASSSAGCCKSSCVSRTSSSCSRRMACGNS